MKALMVAAACVVGVFASVSAAQQGDPRKDNPEGTDIYESLRLKVPEPRKDQLLLPPTSKQVVATGKRHALIVGVREAEYKGIKQKPLPQCVFDCAAMAKTLRAAGYQCEVLSDDEPNKPTVKNIEASLWRICTVAGPDDQILVYLSSHGGFDDGAAWFLGADGGVKISDIKKEMSGSKALVRLLLLDCCRDDKKFSTATSEYRDIHVISACRPDEESQTGPNGLSTFTEAFVDGVTDCRADRVRDGKLELDEVLYYLDTEVPKRAEKYHPGSKQNPTRTVVDPKAVNPIIAVCDSARASLSLQPIAFAGPSAAPGRNDWILSSLLIQKVSPGMTPAEMEAAMGGPPTELLTLDDKGAGETYYDDTPRAGDATSVVFEGGKVVKVFVFFKKMCKGVFNPGITRTEVAKVLEGDPVETLGDKLKGISVDELQKKLGCAGTALVAADGTGDGQLRYPDVPRPSQTTIFFIKDGKVESADVVLTN